VTGTSVAVAFVAIHELGSHPPANPNPDCPGGGDYTLPPYKLLTGITDPQRVTPTLSMQPSLFSGVPATNLLRK
jgi:hypothetical protein